MSITRLNTLLFLGFTFSIAIGCLALTNVVQAEQVTKVQIQSLAPSEQDLQGFVQVRPAGELSEGWAPKVWSSQTQTLTDPISPTVFLEDEVSLNVTSILQRTFYSQDGAYRLHLHIELCDSPNSAAQQATEFRRGSQSAFRRGTFEDNVVMGDESWVLASRSGTDNVLLCRIGKMMIFVVGGLSASATRHQLNGEFPKFAVEAAAFQAILRASQQTALTGVPAQNAHLAVNGHALPKNALKVAGRVYVPVQEFAKAMGLTSRWNAKTGALTLSGPKQKTVSLTAGSTAASVGGAKASALAVPVLKDGGQPVMTLDDLLKLTGGRITNHVGNTVQVKG